MSITASDLTSRMTCGCCPEQWDVFLDGEQVGYMRYRFGSFTVECPDACDELVHESEYGDEMQGVGLPQSHINAGLNAIADWVNARGDAS